MLVALIMAGPCAAQQNITAPNGVVVYRDVNHSTFNIGLTPEQLKEAIDAAIKGATGPLVDRFADISRRLG